MGRTRRPLPKELNLAATLASRLNQIREFRNMSKQDLAQASRISDKRIDDIEAGLETWLSSSDRQIIAKALFIDPRILKEAEYRPDERSHPSYAAMSQSINKELEDSILNGSRDLACPQCGENLRCSVQERRDIYNQKIYFAKAFCTKCPFTLQ